MPSGAVPNASKRGAKSQVAHKWGQWLHNPCRLWGSPMLHSWGQKQKWPTGGPGGYITLPPNPATCGSPVLQSGEQN